MFFKNIIGHSKIKELFENAFLLGRIGHAYMFQGMAGIGKKVFALELAKLLNCESTDKSKLPCNECNTCCRINNGNYSDVRIVEPDGKNIKIEQIRDIIKEVAYYTLEAKKRVVIIDNAETMNASATNCFLKTLEEAPLNTVFVLIVQASSLPQTILSRCQIIKFASLKPNEVKEVLSKGIVGPQIINDMQLKLASGSVERALHFMQKLNAEDVFKFLKDFISLKKDSYNKLFDYTESAVDLFDLNEIIIIFKTFMSDVFKNNLIHKNSNLEDKYSLLINEYKISSLEKINYNLDHINSLEKELHYNLNKRIFVERLVMGLL